jgi:hypothetical protein
VAYDGHGQEIYTIEVGGGGKSRVTDTKHYACDHSWGAVRGGRLPNTDPSKQRAGAAGPSPPFCPYPFSPSSLRPSLSLIQSSCFWPLGIVAPSRSLAERSCSLR